MSALPIDFALAWDSLPQMAEGLVTTLLITVLVLVLGLPLSVLVTLARMSRSRILSWPAAAFVVFFRGAPLLILLYLVYYGFGQIEALRDGPLWVIFGSAFACAVIGLTLNHVAYMVEVVRGSLNAVPAGLVEASAALGLTPRETFTYIRLPLAMRYGLAAYQNEVVMFTKGTAVVSVITVIDLTAVANELFEETYDPFTPMLTAAAFYWCLVNAIRLGFGALENHLNRHQRREQAVKPTTPAGAAAAAAEPPAGAPVAPLRRMIGSDRRPVPVKAAAPALSTATPKEHAL
ncbi:ABC transporter permease subunit [Chthonobacter rhizosphaerae]|uniref:ABC transporter permease subunit n=1 Tax=Chthonobacter rhizosphaerae TaxID=2735553 RepID=UPI0015EE4B21|nr:ABC transporter permease subunit [Chthonobacter rhizosphaerae]